MSYLGTLLYLFGLAALVWWCVVAMPAHARRFQGRCPECARDQPFCICRKDLDDD